MLPLFLKPHFWSYRFEDLDEKRDQRLIIKQVLNYGDQQALGWLFSAYSSAAIRNAFQQTYRGDYSRKSLHFWQNLFGVTLRSRMDVIGGMYAMT